MISRPALPDQYPFIKHGRSALTGFFIFAALYFSFGVMGFVAAPPAQGQAAAPAEAFWQQIQAETALRPGTPSPEKPRCLTSHIIAAHRGEHAWLSSLPEQPEFGGENSYQSPGGGFLIWYDLSGEHAVPPQDGSGSGIPDWIEHIALAADSARTFFGALGFRDPVGAQPYNIYLRNLGVYGFTSLQEGEPFSVIDSTFDWVPGNDAPDEQAGAARVTVAHEIYHAIQYRYNSWNGPTGSTAWLEMDALSAEHQVFPEVREYLNFIGDDSIFRLPGQGTPVAYAHATWLMYFLEAVSADFMRHIWERIEAHPETTMETAIAAELQSRGLDYTTELTRLHLWHLASGAWSRPGFGFADAARYPTSFKRSQRTTLPDSPYPLWNIAPSAASYYALVPQQSPGGSALAAFFADLPESGWGLIAYFTDGSTATALPQRAPGLQPLLFTSGWDWDAIEQLGMVVINASPARTAIHQLLLGNENSIEQIRYGDVLGNGAITETDALRVLEEITGAAEVRLGFAAAYAADVNGSGELSAFDAGRIFRRSSGFSMPFPADLNGTGFGPDLPRFFPGETRQQQVRGSFGGFVSGDGITPSSGAQPEITLWLEAEPLYRGEEASVDVTVAGLPENALSAELTLFYPANLLQFTGVSSGASGFGEIIQAWHEPEPGKVRIAWASNQFTGDGPLGTLLFQILEAGTAELVPAEARINEIAAVYQLQPVSFETDPNDPVSLEPAGGEQPERIALLPPWPNPFNPRTNISFELPESAEVSLRVYDSLGRQVESLLSYSTMPAGTHTLSWDAGQYASGVYVLVMTYRNDQGLQGRVARNVSFVK